MSLMVKPLGKHFAAEISGRVFRQPPDEEQVAEIETAMSQYAVVALRDQSLDDDQQIAFSRAFGPLELPPNLGIRKFDSLGRIRPELFDVSNLDNQGEIEKSDSPKRQFGKANELFHTDSSYHNMLTKWSLLSARVLPSGGGFTDFIDMRLVYAALPDDIKTQLDDLGVEHSLWRSRERAGFAPASAAMRDAAPPVVQPLTGTAADGRKTLYISSHAADIVGWPVNKGRVLLDWLYDFACEQVQYRYRHHWQPNDLLIWDNRCTMHRGVPFDERNEKRDMRRATINESGVEQALTDSV
jgi:alpha-ketoglutarate-dependent 2,4-dichlorophenoxyacetate dioxygenase